MINRSFFDIDWAKLRKSLVPTFLRRIIQLDWLKNILSPLDSLHTSKQAWRERRRYEMNHNGQVIYLEKMLNEKYNVSGYDPDDHQATKQIYIGPGEQLPRQYVFKKVENQPVYIFKSSEGEPPYYLFQESEFTSFYANFIIWFPFAITFEEAEVRAAVDFYINTRFYKIKTY